MLILLTASDGVTYLVDEADLHEGGDLAELCICAYKDFMNFYIYPEDLRKFLRVALSDHVEIRFNETSYFMATSIFKEMKETVNILQLSNAVATSKVFLKNRFGAKQLVKMYIEEMQGEEPRPYKGNT